MSQLDSNVTILSDSHGKGLAKLLRDKFRTESNIDEIVLPGAMLHQVMSRTPNLSQTPKDYIVSVAGANDIYRNQTSNIYNNMKRAITSLQPCTVIVETLPFRRNLPHSHTINENIMMCNLHIHELSQAMKNVFS